MKASSATIKHVPFESIYRQEYEVVEEHRGNLRLYPHTDQLPIISRAINLEFYGALPNKVAHVDHRADGFHKVILKNSALLFCASINECRSDQLRLFQLPTPDLVSRVAVVQQITEPTAHGPIHRFRFYSGDDFLPDIHLSGRKLLFADHVLQRFSSRVNGNIASDLSKFLLVFYGAPFISMAVGPGRAFILPYEETILGFTYRETDGGFLMTTCLTVNEISSLDLDIAPATYNLHFGPAFTRPRIRNWIPTKQAIGYYKSWDRKAPLPPPAKQREKPYDWHHMAYWIREHFIKLGHGPGSRLVFQDNIYGPMTIDILPNQREGQYDELAAYKAQDPDTDWEAEFRRVDMSAAPPILHS